MRTKKEHYRRKLPHFQQPGQSYFVTFVLKGTMPKGAMKKYLEVLEQAKIHLKQLKTLIPPKESKNERLSTELQQAKNRYLIALRKYRAAYDKTLHKSNNDHFSLIKPDNSVIIKEALQFWENKKLHIHAWCIMSNHVHWVISLYNVDENNNPVYLEDILHSVKLFSARRINANENREGQLWEHESFDTTIRNDRHFINTVNYTIQNPVSAHLVEHWPAWQHTYLEPKLYNLF